MPRRDHPPATIHPLSIYVHIPFCLKKCLYCGFFSRPYETDESERFVGAVTSEIRASRYRGRPVSSLFFGGGTPTLLDPDQIERIVAALREVFILTEKGTDSRRESLSESEWTIECNPGTLGEDSAMRLLQIGFNRFSLGAQSFSDRFLKILGRSHSAGAIRSTYSMLRDRGVSNISLDLIYGLPGQSLEDWQQDVENALSLQPQPKHLSVYGLSIEPGTEYGRLFANPSRRPPAEGYPALPGEEAEADMYELAHDRLEAAGYLPYEISNFSLPGFECRHNLAYWTDRPYLGFGPGAASYDGETRWRNTSKWDEYLDTALRGRSAREEEEKLPGADKFAEELCILLRLSRGVDLPALLRKHRMEPSPSLERMLDDLVSCSLLEKIPENRFRLTVRGKLLASEVSIRLMQSIEDSAGAG